MNQLIHAFFFLCVFHIHRVLSSVHSNVGSEWILTSQDSVGGCVVCVCREFSGMIGFSFQQELIFVLVFFARFSGGWFIFKFLWISFCVSGR